MQLTIKYFGMLTEATKHTEERMHTNTCSVLELVEKLKNQYPELKYKDFKVAVNHQLVSDDYLINNEAEIALLPPFAGG
ncbi:MoaD/ThiS family protein [Aquimarina sp. 2201CG1-2-11]|uniref:MoaD/ThiS family protein n=1 Tax=Aquimarina discodermiae TaxID=3231043 RepID=UPI0034637CF5